MVFQITVRSQKVPASVLKAKKIARSTKKNKHTQNTPKAPTSTPVPAIFRQFLQKKPLHNKSSPHKKILIKHNPFI